MRRPVNQPYTITTEFGQPDSYAAFGRHSGVDYAVPLNRPIYAPKAGTIVYAQLHPTGGNMVIIFDGQFYHRLMHNNVMNVSVGAKVSEGQQVSQAGTTGLSTGVHCHWDIVKAQVPRSFADFISPADWLAGTYEVHQTTQLQPFQRQVGASGSNYRKAPNTSAAIIQEFPANDILDFKGFVRGETYATNNVWFVGRYSGGYCWSGSFIDSGTHDLPDLTPVDVVVPPPVVTPPVETPPQTVPEAPGYTFTKDLDCVTEVIPAGEKSFERGNFPSRPQKVVIHDFGTRGKDTFESAVNWFKKPDNISAHFVVSGKNIVQMVSLKDRAYHAGPNGNDFVGIESDPVQDADTVASTQTLVRQLNDKYGYVLTPVKHSSIMATACGDDINLDNYTVASPGSSLEDRVKALEDFVSKIKEL